MSEDTLLLQGLPAALGAAIVCCKDNARAIDSFDTRENQEIEPLKLRTKQLEQSVNTLGGLNEEVKAIDRKVESRSTKQGESELGSR